MAAQEERSYRTLSRKTVEAEERSSLLKNLVKMKVGFREVEEFINNEENKLRENSKFKQGREFIENVMRSKLRDNNQSLKKLRTRKGKARTRL